MPLNPIYTEDELVGPLLNTMPKVIITLTPFYERVKAVQERVGSPRVIATNIKEYFPALLRTVFTLFMERRHGHRITLHAGDLWMQDLLAAHRDAPRPAPTRSCPQRRPYPTASSC